MPTLKIYDLLDYGCRYELDNSYYSHSKTYLASGTQYSSSASTYLIRSVYTFDLTKIPSNIIISNATINMKVKSCYYTGDFVEYRNVVIHTVSESWKFSDLQYGYPEYNSTYESIVSPVSPNNWYSLDVTNYAKKVYSKTAENYGLLIRHQKDDLSKNVDNYCSYYLPTDASIDNRPYIQITYTLPPPNIPTNTNPSNGERLLKNSVIRFSWQHNPLVSGEAQKSFDMQWRKQGETTWNIVSQTTTMQYYDVVANTFPNGTIEYQVRTYDQNGTPSAYSSTAIFISGEIPTTPTITAPVNGSVVSVPLPTLTWTATTQVAFNLILTDSSGTSVLWEYAANNAETRSKQIEYVLENNSSYKIYLKVNNAEGFWSENALTTISTNFPVPTKPTCNISLNATRGSAIIAIVNPTETPPHLAVSSNQIFRKLAESAIWERIATNIAKNGTYVDYTLQPNTGYEYKVRAVSESMAYNDSDNIPISVNIQSAQLALTSDYSQYINLTMTDSKKKNMQYETSKLLFSNRNKPVFEFSGMENEVIDLQFSIIDQSDLKKLEQMIKCKKALLYRDNKNRKVFGAIEAYNVEDCNPKYYKVSLNICGVSFDEVV